MLQRVVHRFKAAAARRKDHELAFLAESARDSNGCTKFQQLCVDLVNSTFPSVQFELGTHQDGTLMLVASLTASNEQVYVYENEAGIFGSVTSEPLEEWDFNTPAELRAGLLQALHRRLSPKLPGQS
jgi:hypothetical protein